MILGKREFSLILKLRQKNDNWEIAITKVCGPNNRNNREIFGENKGSREEMEYSMGDRWGFQP